MQDKLVDVIKARARLFDLSVVWWCRHKFRGGLDESYGKAGGKLRLTMGGSCGDTPVMMIQISILLEKCRVIWNG